MTDKPITYAMLRFADATEIMIEFSGQHLDQALAELRLAATGDTTMHQASDTGDDDAELIELLELAGDYGCDVFNSFPDKTSPCALRVEADVNRFNAARDRLQAKAHD
jgi:hypothetical protein